MIRLKSKRGLAILLALCAVGLAGCMSMSQAEEERQETETQETVSEENVEDTYRKSYLTGLELAEDEVNGRPLAVMFNNAEGSLPQAGIAAASIVYEAPVEGRITRIMGIYEDYEDLERIGSIRSSRDYFVYFALEYDSIYVHFGQATPYVGDLINSDRVDNLSGNVAGIDQPAPNTFYRSDDRKAPNNVYLRPEGILQDIEKFQYRTSLREDYQPKFTFNEEGEAGADGVEATVLYPGGTGTTQANGFALTQSRFEYNEEDGLYYRFQYGDEQIDELTGEQLAYANVVFQYCHGEVRDENDYLAFGCHGDDGYKVQVFTGGKMVEGTWSRMADEVPAAYVDEEGNPIELNPGKTWVCIIWNEYGDDVAFE